MYIIMAPQPVKSVMVSLTIIDTQVFITVLKDIAIPPNTKLILLDS